MLWEGGGSNRTVAIPKGTVVTDNISVIVLLLI
jgi:hypothetical protein